MSPLAVELIRRLSVLGLVLSLLLLVVPRALSEFGLWGPGIEEQVGAAQRSLEAARAYGGRSDDAAFRSAQEDLSRARKLADNGQGWSARQAVRHAVTNAIEAQRIALTTRESARRQAATAASDIDRRLNELEDLYTQVSRRPGAVDAEKTLLPMMKDARRAGANVLLAIEEGEFGRALQLQPDAVVVLETSRKTLQSYKLNSLER
jgi:hypothetical protein